MSKQIKVAGLLLALAFGLIPFGVIQAQTPPPATSVPAGGVTLYGLTTSNKLLRFNSGTPGTIESTVQVSGLGTDESLVGIDFRPATGQLFGISSGSRLYTIDMGTGASTAVGSAPLTTTLSGANFGFDFNPAVDRIRVTSDDDQDLRLNPNNGAVAAIDGTLTYTTTDTNTGKNPNIFASAYTNNVPGPASTVLYDLDSNLDVLVTQNPPNSGTLNTVGPLGMDVTAVGGFDIVGANTAFAALAPTGGEANTTNLYTINLSTGAATMVGAIGGGEAVRGLTGMLSAAPATVTPVPATATMTAQSTATAQVTATSQATTQTTAEATTPPLPTSEPVPPTAIVVPTVEPTVVAPMPGGMPTTGQGDMVLYLLLPMMALAFLSLGWMVHRKAAAKQ